LFVVTYAGALQTGAMIVGCAFASAASAIAGRSQCSVYEHSTTYWKIVKMELTARQSEVLRFIIRCEAREQSAPTFRQLCEHFEFASPNSAAIHLKALERKGAVVRSGERYVAKRTGDYWRHWWKDLPAASKRLAGQSYEQREAV
jgi:hypothetical protein